MPNRVRILTVPEADRAMLERRARDRGSPARVAERARIVLLAADGLTGPQIAERVGCSEPTVIKWRGQEGGGGARPRGGRPKDGAHRRGGVRDPVRHGDAAAAVPAGPGGDALVEPAAGGLAGAGGEKHGP